MHRGGPLHDDKLDFPFVDIPEIAKLGIALKTILRLRSLRTEVYMYLERYFGILGSIGKHKRVICDGY